jgi:hypothetical protein
MSFRIPALAVLALFGLGICSGSASAQPVPPAVPQQPAFSPYLNLLGPWGPAIGYFGIAQPQMQFAQQQLQMQQQIGQTNQNIANLQNNLQNGRFLNPMIGPTGRGAGFNNLGHWYPLARNGGGGATRPPTVVRR